MSVEQTVIPMGTLTSDPPFAIVRYWLMHFDANPLIVQELGKKLLVDSRVLRHTFVKLGDKLETVVARPDKTH